MPANQYTSRKAQRIQKIRELIYDMLDGCREEGEPYHPPLPEELLLIRYLLLCEKLYFKPTEEEALRRIAKESTAPPEPEIRGTGNVPLELIVRMEQESMDQDKNSNTKPSSEDEDADI